MTPAADATPAGRSVRVLLIEDETLISDFIQDVLAGTRFVPVGVAERGEEALELAAATSPDVALVDITLKGGMSGIDTARILRTRHAVRLAFATGSHDPHTRALAEAVGPDGFLLKPFIPRQLIALLERLTPADAA